MLDRASKAWILANVGEYETWRVIPGLLHIVRAENRGMAFSVLADASEGVRMLLLVVLAVAVMGVIAWMLWKTAPDAREGAQRLSLSLVLGGAAGNLWDRIKRGSVTDFLDVHIGEYHWPTFNVADSGITVGAIVLLAAMWRRPRG
jgi:signal peptidase II